MEGTFRRELSEFNDAEELLNRAVLFFALLGSVAVVHQVVLSLGTLYFKRGNTRDALDAVAKVLANLDEGDDPRLYWLTRFNHAVYLAEAGLFEEAQKELAACLRAPGLRTVRDEFLADGHGINMALVSLDLAKLSLERDETAELRRLAEELVVVFSANDVHREALAALMLFQEAVRREAVTAGYLLRLRRYLDAARNNPCLEFERPS